MKHERKILSTGEIIDIFDDVFEYHEMVSFQNFIQRSYFRLRSAATDFVEQKDYTINWQSFYDNDDLKKLGLFDSKNFEEIKTFLNEKEPVRSWVNCLVTSSIASCHVDEPKKQSAKSLIYYSNLKWEKELGGETLFYNSKSSPEFIVEYVPNRIVVYDSHIPHKPLQHVSFSSSSQYRFTFIAIFYKKESDN